MRTLEEIIDRGLKGEEVSTTEVLRVLAARIGELMDRVTTLENKENKR